MRAVKVDFAEVDFTLELIFCLNKFLPGKFYCYLLYLL